MSKIIDRFSGDYAFLSNFYPILIEYEEITYNSVEHAYQAAKTLDIDQRMAIAALSTSSAAKQAGKRITLRPDWSKIKKSIMYDLCWQKFNDPTLRGRLLATGDDVLIEGNWWNDRYWGICRGVGENHLGKILTKIRELLRLGVTR